MRDYLTLADLLTETLSIECEPCGRRGRYNVAKLMEQSSPIAPRRNRRASMTGARCATARTAGSADSPRLDPAADKTVK